MHLLRQCCNAGDVWPLQHAITRNVRINNRGYPSRGHALRKSNGLNLRHSLPAACGNLSITAVNAHTYLSRKTGCRSYQCVPLLQRRRTEHNSLYAGVHSTTDGVQIAQSPSQLHGNGDGSYDGLDHPKIVHLPGKSPIEVDGMQQRCSGLCPALSHGHRVIPVDGLLVCLPLQQAYTFASANVNARNYLHTLLPATASAEGAQFNVPPYPDSGQKNSARCAGPSADFSQGEIVWHRGCRAIA